MSVLSSVSPSSSKYSFRYLPEHCEVWIKTLSKTLEVHKPLQILHEGVSLDCRSEQGSDAIPVGASEAVNI